MASNKQISEPSKRVPTTVRDFFFEDPHFKDTWEHFDTLKDSMFKESRDMWKKMDEDFRKQRCMRDNIMLEGGEENKSPSKGAVVSAPSDNLAKYENGWMFPRRWMCPFLDSLDKLSNEVDLFKGSDHEVVRTKDDDKQMEITLDTSHYRPDELHVSYKNGVLSIEGKHEEKAEDGKHMVVRQFSRKYSVPSKPENITSNLSSDGVLVVKALKGPVSGDIEIKQIK
eukprot:TRINITY_DN358_c0_g1_i1.p1 TRINITY_DN358_c0_g1~~TRINITY_DN358_c0_g1_i1.p1  ORF type:complete len:226 (-),score=84.99 TRINITY_DN358_c0_g1_i1:69-746(-)